MKNNKLTKKELSFLKELNTSLKAKRKQTEKNKLLNKVEKRLKNKSPLKTNKGGVQNEQ